MKQVAGNGAWRIGWLWIVLCSAGFGCAYTPVRPVVEPAASDGLTAELAQIDSATRTAEPAATQPEALASRWQTYGGQWSPQGEPVAIVLNDPRHAQLEMLQVFSARLGRPYRIFNLAHRSRESVRLSLIELAPIQVIALGPAAFETTALISGLDVFYSGVLNPGRTTQGVDALPPFGDQLDYWQSLAPEITRLGVVASPALAWRVDALAAACAARGMTLERRMVRSDKETQFAFRSMVPHIDGFVFLPDDEVLSPTVIAQVMRHGKRNDVQILVYSPVMFNLGAALFLQPDPVEVAVSLIELLKDPKKQQVVSRMRSKSRLATPLQVGDAGGSVSIKLARVAN